MSNLCPSPQKSSLPKTNEAAKANSTSYKKIWRFLLLAVAALTVESCDGSQPSPTLTATFRGTNEAGVISRPWTGPPQPPVAMLKLSDGSASQIGNLIYAEWERAGGTRFEAPLSPQSFPTPLTVPSGSGITLSFQSAIAPAGVDVRLSQNIDSSGMPVGTTTRIECGGAPSTTPLGSGPITAVWMFAIERKSSSIVIHNNG